MALQGNLRDFSITQLLNLINLAKKSGALLVSRNERGARMFFRNGVLVFAERNGEAHSLPKILSQSKQISDNQISTLQGRSNNASDKELGLMLVNAGYISQEDILTSLKDHFSEIVRQLFPWDEGEFKFDDQQTLSENNIPVAISLENLVIEGSRQTRETDQLKLEIPDLNMALAFTERPGIDLKKFSLSADEWRVVSYINPKNSIAEIAKTTKQSDVQMRRIIFALLEAGIVKLIRPEGAPTKLDGLKSAFPGVKQPEQKKLVARLIDRIRSI